MLTAKRGWWRVDEWRARFGFRGFPNPESSKINLGITREENGDLIVKVRQQNSGIFMLIPHKKNGSIFLPV